MLQSKHFRPHSIKIEKAWIQISAPHGVNTDILTTEKETYYVKLTHSLTHSLTYLLPYLFIYLLTYFLTYLLLTYLFNYLLTFLITYLLTYLLTAIEVLLGESSPYTSTDKTNYNTYP